VCTTPCTITRVPGGGNCRAGRGVVEVGGLEVSGGASLGACEICSSEGVDIGSAVRICSVRSSDIGANESSAEETVSATGIESDWDIGCSSTAS